VRLNPVLAGLGTYPFVRLDEAKRDAAARGIELIDFGAGEPREETPRFIRQAFADAIEPLSSYPKADGLPELREAIAAWARRRFAVELDPDRELIPTYGSKEAIFLFAQVVLDAAAGKDLVLLPEPGYPVYERGALFAGAELGTLPLRADNDFLPDLDAVDDETWSRTALVWVCYPNNPTGAVAPLEFYERLSEIALEHDVLVCSDEAYTELWFDEPPASALQVADRRNMVVFNTLSKRSSMTGYRCGFVAANEDVIESLRKFRPNVGTAPQVFVQRAAIAAWGDEEHVERNRALYGRKRALFLDLFARKGVALAGSRATMYLWVETPRDETSVSLAERLLEHGVVVAPGSYFGPAGEGYVRFALVPTEAECAEAVAVLEDAL
jgi:succinyldiaminopimelate transaminase